MWAAPFWAYTVWHKRLNAKVKKASEAASPLAASEALTGCAEYGKLFLCRVRPLYSAGNRILAALLRSYVQKEVLLWQLSVSMKA